MCIGSPLLTHVRLIQRTAHKQADGEISFLLQKCAGNQETLTWNVSAGFLQKLRLTRASMPNTFKPSELVLTNCPSVEHNVLACRISLMMMILFSLCLVSLKF